jgi:Eukaryotic protein of unknown function (DUF829)
MAERTPLLSDSSLPNADGPVETSTIVQNGATGLSKLSSTVYFHRAAGRPSNNSPSAILLFGWMGAPIRHMMKFVDYYSQTIFPGTPIILVLAPRNQVIAKQEKRKRALKPAYIAYQSLDIQPENTLVHIFSNGGVNNFRDFVSLTPSNSFSPREMIMDSAPGIATLGMVIAAFTVDIKNPISRFFMSILLTILFLLLKLKDWALGQESILHRQRRWLVDGNGIGKTTKRVFLYSDMDELVQKDSVEEHIRDLKERGYPVRSRNFGMTRHVGHMRANPEEYWSEILKGWKE